MSYMVYHQITSIRPGSPYINTYRIRSKNTYSDTKSQNKSSNKDRKRNSELEIQKQSVSIKAKLKYGKVIFDDHNDVRPSDLTKEMEVYYEKM